MEIWNYCPSCGKRLHHNEMFCENCGINTVFDEGLEDSLFTFPINSINFFDLKINFSPFIDNYDDFDYEICSCGYLNEVDNEFCYHCGVKRFEKGISRFIKKYDTPRMDFDNFPSEYSVICECGTINSSDNEFCNMCGCKLNNDEDSGDNYSNFNLEFDKSVFCFCGSENEFDDLFCNNCGLPLIKYGKQKDIQILCVCSELNNVTSQFCHSCGANLDEEKYALICVCGSKNPINSKYCSSCNRPLNPERHIKTRIVCSCGQIVNFDSEFCPNCGKNIMRTINNKKHLSSTLDSVKRMFR